MSTLSSTLVACDRKPIQVSYLHIYLLIFWKAIGQNSHYTAKVEVGPRAGNAKDVNMLISWPVGLIISYQLPSFSRKKMDRDLS